MQHEHVRGADIIYRQRCQPYVSDYHSYVLSLIREVVPSSSMVTLEIPKINFMLRNPVRISINYEHTLVQNGGRDSDNYPTGIISVINDRTQKYLVRLVNHAYLEECDIVIDYSIPNIFNITSSRKFPKLADSLVYIAPCLYPISWKLEGRTIDILSTFLDLNVTRRKMFLEHCTNVSNCFDRNELCTLYQRTKIIINVHQTDEHHTAEELRILPALQNGVIVVSEQSPLVDMIPYGHLVIWVPYEKILETAKSVLASYEETHARIFTPRNMEILQSLHYSNLNRLRDKFSGNVK